MTSTGGRSILDIGGYRVYQDRRQLLISRATNGSAGGTRHPVISVRMSYVATLVALGVACQGCNESSHESAPVEAFVRTEEPPPQKETPVLTPPVVEFTAPAMAKVKEVVASAGISEAWALRLEASWPKRVCSPSTSCGSTPTRPHRRIIPSSWAGSRLSFSSGRSIGCAVRRSISVRRTASRALSSTLRTSRTSFSRSGGLCWSPILSQPPIEIPELRSRGYPSVAA